MAHTKPDTPPPMIATDGPVGMDIIWRKKNNVHVSDNNVCIPDSTEEGGKWY